jgi:hypothetical protein
MEKFAKLLEVEGIGQVLAVLDDSKEPKMGACLKVSFQGGVGFGVCSVKLDFKDGDDGWTAAEAALENFDEDTARRMVEPVIKQFAGTFGGRLK